MQLPGPFRLEPKMGAAAYKTYQLRSPVSTHFRPATCAEVGCQHYTKGWWSRIDETSTLGQMQAHYIRKQSGRSFTETREADGLTRFDFEAGQTCFASDKHVKSLQREPLYIVRDGDYRGNPRGTTPRRHANGDDWVDDFASHQDTLHTAFERG